MDRNPRHVEHRPGSEALERGHGGEHRGEHRPKIANRVRDPGNERLRAELRYAAEHAIPYTLFTGQRGNPAPGEPLWTDEDVEAALAWQELQDATCRGCGNPLEESMNADNESAYVVKTLVCHGCRAVEKEAKKQQDTGADMSGRRHISVLEGRQVG